MLNMPVSESLKNIIQCYLSLRAEKLHKKYRGILSYSTLNRDVDFEKNEMNIQRKSRYHKTSIRSNSNIDIYVEIDCIDLYNFK